MSEKLPNQPHIKNQISREFKKLSPQEEEALLKLDINEVDFGKDPSSYELVGEAVETHENLGYKKPELVHDVSKNFIEQRGEQLLERIHTYEKWASRFSEINSKTTYIIGSKEYASIFTDEEIAELVHILENLPLENNSENLTSDQLKSLGLVSRDETLIRSVCLKIREDASKAADLTPEETQIIQNISKKLKNQVNNLQKMLNIEETKN